MFNGYCFILSLCEFLIQYSASPFKLLFLENIIIVAFFFLLNIMILSYFPSLHIICQL